MITLCMDSAHKYLTIALFKDDQVLASSSKEAWKQQSETIFPELVKLMEDAHLQSEDIDQVVISDGPGSYTGVRIAMTIAKVFCTTMHKPLYTISTLQLYAGLEDQAMVMLDARSNRAYTAWISKGKIQEEILTLDEILRKLEDNTFIMFGDLKLIGKQEEPVNFVENFIKLKKEWQFVENIHTLVPRYLKEQDSYKVS